MEIPEIDIKEIDADGAAARLAAGDALFLDVRDEGSYRAAHVPGAVHASDATIQQFLEQTDKRQTVIVYCYHGHASLGGAAYLAGHGFADVFSLRGGFEGWRPGHPHESA